MDDNRLLLARRSASALMALAADFGFSLTKDVSIRYSTWIAIAPAFANFGRRSPVNRDRNGGLCHLAWIKARTDRRVATATLL